MPLPPIGLPTVRPLDRSLEVRLRAKLDAKTKPVGSLGRLEELAVQIGLIQKSDSPVIHDPAVIVYAADHGIARSGVSAYPQEVTYQMVLNFLNKGAAINVLARQHGMKLMVVNAGVIGEFAPHDLLLDRPIAQGSRNFLEEPAMTSDECRDALQLGRDSVAAHCSSNVIVFGEMGIGNTSSAALLMSILTGFQLEECIGVGTGLDAEGLERKKRTLGEARLCHKVDSSDPFQVLCTFGGLEIAAIVGAALEAAARGMVILVDGFIVTSAMLTAAKLEPSLLDYCVFSHSSAEAGHRALLEQLGVVPFLNLGLRLGEGTGAVLLYPLVESAVRCLNEMASFEEAGVSKCSEES